MSIKRGEKEFFDLILVTVISISHFTSLSLFGNFWVKQKGNRR